MHRMAWIAVSLVVLVTGVAESVPISVGGGAESVPISGGGGAESVPISVGAARTNWDCHPYDGPALCKRDIDCAGSMTCEPWKVVWGGCICKGAAEPSGIALPGRR